jgi:hypothetical protein
VREDGADDVAADAAGGANHCGGHRVSLRRGRAADSSFNHEPCGLSINAVIAESASITGGRSGAQESRVTTSASTSASAAATNAAMLMSP